MLIETSNQSSIELAIQNVLRKNFLEQQAITWKPIKVELVINSQLTNDFFGKFVCLCFRQSFRFVKVTFPKIILIIYDFEKILLIIHIRWVCTLFSSYIHLDKNLNWSVEDFFRCENQILISSFSFLCMLLSFLSVEIILKTHFYWISIFFLPDSKIFSVIFFHRLFWFLSFFCTKDNAICMHEGKTPKISTEFVVRVFIKTVTTNR